MDIDCRITTKSAAGWNAVVLENDLIRVVILPERGAELYRLVYKPASVDVLFQSPWGLQPPGAPPRAGSGDSEFLWNYGGGWQELFPSANHACLHQGRVIPFHGEVATIPWDLTAAHCSGAAATVVFAVHCRETPFHLERRMSLRRGEATLYFEETIRNVSQAPAHFVWGQHCVVGAPFLAAGCRLHAPARRLHTDPLLNEATARLAPGQTGQWPMAQLRAGGLINLTEVPGPEAHTHDGVFLTDLAGGWVAVSNPTLDLTFSLHWDPAVYKWLIVWQPYGGCEAMPLNGTYALGIEPWTARRNLEGALADGEAIELAGGASFSTAFHAMLSPTAAWPDSP